MRTQNLLGRLGSMLLAGVTAGVMAGASVVGAETAREFLEKKKKKKKKEEEDKEGNEDTKKLEENKNSE